MNGKQKTGYLIGGIVIGIGVCFLVPLIVLGTGAWNVAAADPPSRFEKAVAGWAVERSIDPRAPETKNPQAGKPNALEEGREHYREMCVVCHAAPGVEPTEIDKGLNPPAPDLWEKDSQEMSDGELFWTIKNGIRMSGMPAFGKTHGDEKIWDLVLFVRHLPDLSPEETQALRKATAEGDEGGVRAPDSSGGEDGGM